MRAEDSTAAAVASAAASCAHWSCSWRSASARGASAADAEAEAETEADERSFSLRDLTPLLVIRAAHPRQAVVTALGVGVAAALAGRPTREFVLVMGTVLVGQACLGWFNDLVDRGRDARHHATGKPVADARITLDGGMPQHGHGLPTSPMVSADQTAGEYRVEGLKFTMTGWWELRFAITAAAGGDSAVFNVKL